MKSKAIYMGSREGYDRAYNPETQAKINEALEMLPTMYPMEVLRDPATDLSVLRDVEYAFSSWGMPTLTEEEIRKILPNLKAVFYAAGSVQYFALPYMRCGVKIFSAWAANGVPVAEVTASEIILANKGFFQTMQVTGKDWPNHSFGAPYIGNYDTPVGIIGAGMIGTMVIERLKAYRLKVKVFDPFMSEERAKALGVEKVNDLPTLFGECMVISNHLANNPQTERMIDKKCFDRMDPKGVFINTGRGMTVVEEDLIAAMKAEPGRVAVLDVTWPEPPVEGSELYTLPNVILTPHMAGSIGNEVQRMGEYMFEEFTALTSGKPTRWEVSEKMLATMA